jgi:hypothetical protein
MTLEAAIRGAAAAAGLDVHERATDDGGTAWAVDDIVFTVLSPDASSAAFRLDPVLAGAAARTPDVSASSRGPGWIDFAPAVVDGHAIDRATAWFGAAARRAGS